MDDSVQDLSGQTKSIASLFDSELDAAVDEQVESMNNLTLEDAIQDEVVDDEMMEDEEEEAKVRGRGRGRAGKDPLADQVAAIMKINLEKLGSVGNYRKWMERFQGYKELKGIPADRCDEHCLLVYFNYLKDIYAPSSLWVVFSCLRRMIKNTYGVEIKGYSQVKDLIKAEEATWEKTKSAVFTLANIKAFLRGQYPGTMEKWIHVMMCAAVSIGISGLLRCAELKALTWDNLEEIDEGYRFFIPCSKTDKRKRTRNGPRKAKSGFFFVVPSGSEFYFCIAKYIACFPEEAREGQFLKYLDKNMQGSDKKPVGKNTIGGLCKLVAQTLNLPRPETFTGHALRRTGATWLAEGGANEIQLKRAGRWRSSSVAEGYLNETVAEKTNLFAMMTKENCRTSSSTSADQPPPPPPSMNYVNKGAASVEMESEDGENHFSGFDFTNLPEPPTQDPDVDFPSKRARLDFTTPTRTTQPLQQGPPAVIPKSFQKSGGALYFMNCSIKFA